ncbi:LOW QUALITY PROTEIN: proactivator polypeptide-like 1 [Perognathus longimembris pacificus]|uniref:LOW QUALITY PROTEIN: proactivator polypeptide-like 1 n=1 Tax=Perognathus longimembris pacificus TaxID=214514 RepID=UPI002019F1AE|nr:LOW QUALITY PROTEIN: proactivator polypeptide-like 1 [Perognathus longimembris pacificus]
MLRALLLLPGLLGAAAGPPLPGPPDCARGAQVWCRDLQAAAACGAVEHCRRAVWSQPAARSLPCTVCQDVAAAAGDGLNPDATESDVLASVRRTCAWLPDPAPAARCRALVDAHGPAVLALLAGSRDGAPAEVCASLALCEPLQRTLAAPGAPLTPEAASQAVAPFLAKGALSFRPPPPAGGAVCADCLRLVSRLQAALEANRSLAELSAQGQCDALGPGLRAVCQRYLGRLLLPEERRLRLLPPRAVCGAGGFCEARPGPARWPVHMAAADGVPSLEPAPPARNGLQMESGLTCEVCLDVMQQVDRWLERNSTEALISHALERVCAMLPASVLRQCVALVDQYSPSLVELLARVTPEKVCDTLRLCRGGRRARSLPRAPETAPSPPPPPDGEDEGSFCSTCKNLLGVSTRNLDRRATKRDILNAFKGGCSILPVPYLVQCNHFVVQYQPVVIESLKFLMDPTVVCRKIGACHGSRAPLLGSDQCVLGPSFWCKSEEAAELCDALQHCRRFVWKVAPSPAGEQP